MHPQVIVIGSGPAGALTAYWLAKAGKEVLILEKEKHPRPKVCGGGLPARAASWVDFDLGPALLLEMEGAHLSYHGADGVTKVPEFPVGWMVERSIFDQYLVNKALEAGAKIKEETEVLSLEATGDGIKVVSRGEVWESNLVVGADGATGVTARSLGLMRPNRAWAINARIKPSAAAREAQGKFASFSFGEIEGGYGWIFPKGDDFSVGLYTTRKDIKGLKERLLNYIHSQPRLRESTVEGISSHPLPWGDFHAPRHRSTAAGGALLVGDAGGLVDIFFGAGLYYAFASARIAAQNIVAFLEGRQPSIADYSAQIRKELGSDLHWAAVMARWFYRFPLLSYKGMVKNRIICDYFARILSKSMTYKEVSKKIVNQFPRWLFAY